MSTFISTVALLLALSSFETFSSMETSSDSTGSAPVVRMDGTGANGAPVCTNNLPNCGLD